MKYHLSLFFILHLLMSFSTAHAGRVDHQYLDNMSAEGWVLNIDQITPLLENEDYIPKKYTNRDLCNGHNLYVIKIRNKGNKSVKGKIRWALLVEDGAEWRPAHVTFELPPHTPNGQYYVLPNNCIILARNDELPVFKFEWISLKTGG